MFPRLLLLLLCNLHSLHLLPCPLIQPCSYGHIHIVAHAAPGPDGSLLAIGDSGKSSSNAKGADAVVGQAVVPLAPFVRAAANALEIALAIQADDADDDDIAALLGQQSGAGAGGGAGAKKKAGGDKASPIPQQLPLTDQEAAAFSTGVLEGVTSPEAYAKSFNPDGVPWALTGEYALPY